MSRPTLRGRLKANAVGLYRLFDSPSTRNGYQLFSRGEVLRLIHKNQSPIQVMNQKAVFPSLSRFFSIFCSFPFWFLQIVTLNATTWPTEWTFESIENSSSEWWQALRVKTVPGVVYHLQESNSLEDGGWNAISTSYGTGAEWTCPLFPGTAPSSGSVEGQPELPPTSTGAIKLAYLVIERSTTGVTLVSWTSLDDHMPRRIPLPGVILDPVWEEFDSSYVYPHGLHFFALSPRLAAPVEFSESASSLGALDSAMIADFTSALSAITANIQNSVTSAAYINTYPTASSARKFFRISADWDLDSDGDGRFDWQEIIFDNNNPFSIDSNGDGQIDTANGTTATTSTGYPTPTDAVGPTSLATVEQQTVGATRIESPSTTPGDPPGISVYPEFDITGAPNLEDFESAASYGLFKEAVDEFSNPTDSHWTAALHSFACENSVNTMGEGQSSTFRYARARFRLKLDTAAPEGGYQIPVRLAVVHQSIDPETQEASFLPTPLGTQNYVDIILRCLEDQTEGEPVDVLGPADVMLNRRIIFMPITTVTREPDIASTNPNLPPTIPGPINTNGTCVTSDEPFVVECQDPKADIVLWNYEEPPLDIQWMKRKLEGDGTLGEWNVIFQPNPDNPLNPLALTGAHRSVTSLHPGIYQLKAVLVLPDASTIDFPLLRMRDGRSIKNSEDVTNPLLKAGKPDYFGICTNPLSKAVRNKAVEWLGDTGYAKVKDVAIEPGNIFNASFSTAGSPKCNIFVTHIANQVGATTPYFNRIRWGIPTPQTSAPIAKGDWYTNPEANIDVDPPGWNYVDTAVFPATNPTVANFSNQFHSLRNWNGGPCPGMTCASPKTKSGPAYGHVGVMDYDGSWINAGSLTVNKSLHLLDSDAHYKPNNFRAR